MTSQRARYLRRLIGKRRCPKCQCGSLRTAQLDASTYAEPNKTVDGRTVCDRCGYDATHERRRP